MTTRFLKFKPNTNANTTRAERLLDVGEGAYRRGGQRVVAWREGEVTDSIPSCLSRYVDLYRHHALVFKRYEDERRCSPRQLRTIEGLYIEGLSLRELARREGVAPQAISARINSLANKAPQFCRWWRLVTGRRRRRNRCESRRPGMKVDQYFKDG